MSKKTQLTHNRNGWELVSYSFNELTETGTFSYERPLTNEVVPVVRYQPLAKHRNAHLTEL